jgi:hypothetical protein
MPGRDHDEEPYLDRLIRIGQNKFWEASLRQAIPTAKVFPAIWAVESEVNNGGFSQYFLNSSAEGAGRHRRPE